jgi:hypothetical protein
MTQSRKFPAVTVASPLECCDAVKTLNGARMLAIRAPTLPVPACTMPDRCRCRFQKYSDRRDDEQGRRFRYDQERAAWYAGSQRRHSHGRRAAD